MEEIIIGIEDIWGKKPVVQEGDYADTSYGDITLSMPTGKFEERMDAWLERLRAEYALLEEHSGRWLHFVAVDYPEIKESLSPQKLMELREKAENWNKYVKMFGTYHADTMLSVIERWDKLEAVKEFVLGRREDIEKDIEDLGMLKPILEYFLEG